MSKRMADTFFPACLERINHNRFLTFLYHEVIFPESVAQQCPEYRVTYHYSAPSNTATSAESIGTMIRQPFLLLAALWGAWIGLSGFLQFWSSTTSTTTTITRGSRRERTTGMWALALLTFGLMNVSAVFVHCLWPAPSIDYPTDYPLFWAIDTYMTGVSGSCLLVACLEELQARWKPPSILDSGSGSGGDETNNHRATWRLLLLDLLQALPLQNIAITIQLIGVLCIVWFATNPAPQIVASSHPLELWYLVPIVMAGVPTVIVLYENVGVHLYKTVYLPWQKGELSPGDFTMLPLSLGQTAFCSSIFVSGVLGIAMDRVWCSLLVGVGYSLSLMRDFWSANTFVFLGCDLAFWGVVQCLSERLQDERTDDSSRSTDHRKMD